MACIKCGHEENLMFAEELIPCSHCGEAVIIRYYICSDCTVVWREIDGAVDIDYIFDPEENIMNTSVDQMFDTILGGRTGAGRSMNECVNRCLKCNVVSYEVGDGIYRCPACGFEWEILDCG